MRTTQIYLNGTLETVETGKREIYHIYEHPGKYTVRHQACNFCACSDWDLCYKQITVKKEENEQNEHEKRGYPT